MSEPIGFLLTFRTYGTWLHGDKRGSVDKHHHVLGAPLSPPDSWRMQEMKQTSRHEPLVFDFAMRNVVEESLIETCRFQKWELVERAIRTNHVHVIVRYAGASPEQMLQRLKARASRALREQKLIAVDRAVWADGPGSKKYLWKEHDVAEAARYVREYQDEPR